MTIFARMSGFNLLALAAQIMIAALALAFAQPAFAQATFNFTNSTTGAISGVTPCTTPLVRNFTVGTNFTVADVNLGVFATHTWRGDIRITLQSPNGTRVQLVNGGNNSSGDNFNVLLDDSAGTLVNSTNATGAHSTTTPPPFQNNFRPNSPLSAFIGAGSAGTWRMEICDTFTGADNGTFQFAQLQLTSLPANSADLSLTKSVSNANPVSGASISFTLSLNNAGTSTASNVEVFDLMPAGFAFTSSSGDGSFNATSGIWTVPSISAGQTLTLTITGTVTAPAGASVTNYAEVRTSELFDLDSTPNNLSSSEDDDATATFIVQGTRSPGNAPVLSCPAGVNLFDWDTRSWTAGTLSNQYPIANFGDIGFQVSSNGVFANDPAFGGQSPALSNGNTGGLAVVQNSLHQFLNFANRQQTATTVITLPNGVAGAQFTIFDVDFAANDFADQVTVTGSYNGTTVLPVLTNGVSNYVVGNTAVGDLTADNATGNGNVVVTFSEAIDAITITYGNAATAPAVPDGQAISFHDISFCAPDTNLSVTKVSSVISDPVNLTNNPKAIPGATIDYLISLANTGISAVDAGTVVITDNGPADAKLCRIDRSGGPVIVAEPGGATGLTYSFVALGTATDDLEFSNDNGASWAYVPIADADGCDPAVTNFRVTPGGAFAAGRSLALTVRYMIE
jgi:uncharacterized repeat protein (TIGR01451 family)